jgi:hypothetical protein
MPRTDTLVSQIRAGDRVTFADHFGQLRVGRAVMPSAHGGWVLNMGGPHGTPAVVDETNIVRVKKARETARNPELLVVNNPARGPYELHYGSGGHGGPYKNLREAKKRARALLKGSPSERRIYIRRGVAGPLVDTVDKEKNPRRSTKMIKRRRRRNYWKGNKAAHRKAARKGWRKRSRKSSKRRKYSRKGKRGRRVFKGAIKYRGRWYKRKTLINKIGKRRVRKMLKKRGRRANFNPRKRRRSRRN